MAENIEYNKAKDLENENACVVCFKQCLIYSIGSCNHAVCYECSARMRCLCLQNECPICRQDLPKVIFTRTVAPYLTLDREIRSGLYEKKYRIAFADLDIQKSFYHLLENRCPQCSHNPFLEFNKLKEHVRKVHEQFYCEICTDNLKIFSSERRCYTRAHLATHRRIGDPDDKSHKGHPRCEYCELRYLDKDELFRHLRREHYYCHFCDADGNNLFYGAINEMRAHFKAEHFVCEEDECADEQFTAVFRTSIDLQAHISQTHTKGMSKSEVKQARTLDCDFSYAPRGRGGGAERQDQGRGHRSRANDSQREFDRIPEPTVVQQAPIRIDSKNEEQFPSLAGPSGAPSVQLANTVRHITYGTSGLARTKENFPSLGGLPATTNEKSYSQTSSQKPTGKQYKAPTASSMLRGPASSSAKSSTTNRPFSSSSSNGGHRNVSSDFPALSQITSKKSRNKNDLLEDMVLPTNVNMHSVSSKHRSLVEDYGSMASMASKVSKVQTVQQRDVKAVPAEIVKKNVPKLTSVDNFPTLGGGGSSSSSAGTSNAPQWLTVMSNQKTQPMQDAPIKTKRVHEMPVINTTKPSPKNTAKPLPTNTVKPSPPSKLQNGVKKTENVKKTSNGNEKEKEKAKPHNNNKENKNENVFAEKNFPTLGADPTPPPGFLSTKKPPPGFDISSARANGNDELINSVREKLKLNASPDISHSYLAPLNAAKRNQALVSEFQKTLRTPESMQEFRQVSQMFRDGNYFPKSYYETCKIVLGAGFETIFPELLALLPDIEKQQSLYVVFMEELRQLENSGVKPKKKNKSKEMLDVCATCQQVLLTTDLLTHLQSHALENNFPALSAAVKEASSVKQWKK